MKVMILRQIERMKKGCVQRKTGPLVALRIKRDHIRITNLFLQLLCLGPVLLLQLQNLHFVESATNNCPFGAAENERQRRTTSVTTATRWVTGDRNVPFSPQLEPVPQESSKINDKYSNSVCFHDDSFLHDQFEMYIQHVKFLDSIDITSIPKGVKNNLRKHIEFWKHIGANEFVVNTIENGYVIPFLRNPPPMCFENNQLALLHSDFVEKAVSELVKIGCVIETPFQPFIVNPLSVSIQSTSKKRLILDLSELNNFIKKDTVKFEDWKVALNYFSKNCFLFKFDLN